MELETETISRKRKEASNLALATELGRPPWGLKDTLPKAKCLTSKGRELTYNSLVAEGGHCIMDELVKPDFKILDYLTSFSGIMKEILNLVTTKLKDVQKLLREVLPPDAVLVGHSLDLNLRVLKVIHPYVIDTSLLYIGKQGRRLKLRFLAKVILGKDIQYLDKLGHDTTEDARTTLELARYFLKYGPKKIAELNLEAIASHKELRVASQASGNQGAATEHPNMSVLDCLDSMGKLIQYIVGALNKPYFCVQYDVLEAAQLAIETMNGILVEGSYIRVHRPVTEFTLECDTFVHELEQDSENQATIYVAGLEFKTRDSAVVALEILKGKDWKLEGRYVLTPRHLQAWLKDIHPEPAMPSGLGIVPPLLEKHVFQTLKKNHPKIVAWRYNPKIEKLYHSLSPGTLCLILLPGTKNTLGSHPGLGLMKIKEKKKPPQAWEWESPHTFRVPLHIYRMYLGYSPFKRMASFSI